MDHSFSDSQSVQGSNRTRGWWNSKTAKRFRRNPLAIVGVVVIAVFAVIALFAPQLTISADEIGRAHV